MIQRTDILRWLKESDEEALTELWRMADHTRSAFVGDDVHLRGLIECSNCCVRQCRYCGLRADNQNIVRYRMAADEVLGCVADAVRYGYGTVVLQSGEDPGLEDSWVSDLVRRIKQTTSLAITLNLGERNPEELLT